MHFLLLLPSLLPTQHLPAQMYQLTDDEGAFDKNEERLLRAWLNQLVGPKLGCHLETLFDPVMRTVGGVCVHVFDPVMRTVGDVCVHVFDLIIAVDGVCVPKFDFITRTVGDMCVHMFDLTMRTVGGVHVHVCTCAHAQEMLPVFL